MLPEAIAGVVAVAILFHLVARSFGPIPGLLAALALALMPVSVVTARYNTIDSILVVAVLLAAWAVLKSAETGKLRWLLVGAALLGLGFNIKMMEAYLVLPALAALYFFAAPQPLRKRLLRLALAGLVLVIVSFSWITIVDLTPASQRPYVGSSQTNSELELALGYNGIERLTGMLHGAGARGTGASTGGSAGSRDGFTGRGGLWRLAWGNADAWRRVRGGWLRRERRGKPFTPAQRPAWEPSELAAATGAAWAARDRLGDPLARALRPAALVVAAK